MAESNKDSNDLVDDENRNLSSVVCKHCNCLMLKPSTASIIYLEVRNSNTNYIIQLIC